MSAQLPKIVLNVPRIFYGMELLAQSSAPSGSIMQAHNAGNAQVPAQIVSAPIFASHARMASFCLQALADKIALIPSLNSMDNASHVKPHARLALMLLIIA